MYRALLTFFTILVTFFMPVILIAWLLSLSIRTHYGGISVISPKRLMAATVIPVLCGVREFYKKSLTMSGVVAAMFVGFVLTLANASFIASLLVFFLTSSKLTRFRAARKAKQDEESEAGGQRTWLNVFNNGGVPTAITFLYLIEVGCKETVVDFHHPPHFISSWLSVSVLGAIACACGDTWASEVGATMGNGTARLISNGKVVPAGTNGGISVAGTLASLVGGGLIGFTYAITSCIADDFMSFQFSLVWAGLFAGFTGSMIDSCFGATLQFSGFNEETKKVVSKPGPGVKHISGVYFLNNHAINFIACCITSLTTPVVYQIAMEMF